MTRDELAAQLLFELWKADDDFLKLHPGETEDEALLRCARRRVYLAVRQTDLLFEALHPPMSLEPEGTVPFIPPLPDGWGQLTMSIYSPVHIYFNATQLHDGVVANGFGTTVTEAWRAMLADLLNKDKVQPPVVPLTPPPIDNGVSHDHNYDDRIPF